MRIKITADSTCDLPPHLWEAYDVELTSLAVLLGEESFADRREITPARLFEYMAEEGRTCHTAACNVLEYQQVFQKYQDWEGVIHISISSKLSCSHANALQAAEDFKNVHVIDSLNLCCGSALLVEQGTALARAGLPAPEIAARLRAAAAKIDSSFIINSLDYLKRGGRCSALSQLGANLLQMKLCLELEEGYIEAGKKYRGAFPKCLQKYLHDRFANLEGIDNELLYLATSGLDASLIEETRSHLEALNYFKRIETVEAGCVISCHSGPGACGIFFMRH